MWLISEDYCCVHTLGISQSLITVKTGIQSKRVATCHFKFYRRVEINTCYGLSSIIHIFSVSRVVTILTFSLSKIIKNTIESLWLQGFAPYMTTEDWYELSDFHIVLVLHVYAHKTWAYSLNIFRVSLCFIRVDYTIYMLCRNFVTEHEEKRRPKMNKTKTYTKSI